MTADDMALSAAAPENIEVDIQEADDGSVVIDFAPASTEMPIPFGANLAEFMEEDQLSALAEMLISAYEDDRQSRADWEQSYTDGLDLLGVRLEERTTPFPGATGVSHPILTEAVIRFVSQAMMEIFPASGPVKTQIAGLADEQRHAQARRVADFMNYLLTEELRDYRPALEQQLFKTALAGSSFKKIYYNSQLGRPDSLFVAAEDFVIAYGTTDITSSARHTHVMRKTDNFVRKMQVSGLYRDIMLEDSRGTAGEVQEKYDQLTGITEVSRSDMRTLLEIHVELDLPGFEDVDEAGAMTGIALPYVVAIDEQSRQILAIRRNWREDDSQRRARQHFVHYPFQPGLGIYGFGLIHLIGSIAKSSTSVLRQLIDAGTLANLPAGFKARGLRVKSEDQPLEPGEFRDIDVPGGAIKDNIFALPFKEPSSTLLQLMLGMVDEGRRFASIADLNINQNNQEAPVGTTLALIEREMKVLSAVHARLHYAQKQEFQLLAGIIADHMQAYPYDVGMDPAILRSDFDGRVDILPVSDPNSTSFAQRVMQQQTVMQLAAQAPQIYDQRALHRQFLEVIGVEHAERILPDPTAIPIYDPLSENARLMAQTGVKVYPHQDHQAHIAAHNALLQDPSLQENPAGKAIMAALSAHISEHMAHHYRAEAEKQLGQALPPLGGEEGLSAEAEARLALPAAQAAAEITGKARQQAVLEQQLAAAQDPVLQQQREELEIEKSKIAQAAAEARLEAEVDLEQVRLRNAQDDKHLAQERYLTELKLQADLQKEQNKNRPRPDRP